MEEQKKPVILSGITPSGVLMIGHYMGAIRNWVALQHEYECFFMVADLHAITVPQTPADLRRRTLDIAAGYIACGIDPDVCTLFVQSHVPEHTQLTWVLGSITGMGEASRMTQYKDKSSDNSENNNVALFTYPVLMAADILLYQADLVPVGDDQKQHLELTRNLAERFNFRYSPTFTVPEPFIPPVGARVMSLQEPTKKMSKSDKNEKATLFISDSDDAIRMKIKRAVTDSGTDIRFDEKNRPGVANLMTLYSTATGKSNAEIEREFEGLGYAEFKEAAAEAMVGFMRPMRERFLDLRSDTTMLNALLAKGAETARNRARRTLRKVYKKVGFAELG